MSDPERQAKIIAAIEKMPQWLRHELNAPDPKGRERAHEALAAIIIATINGGEADKD